MFDFSAKKSCEYYYGEGQKLYKLKKYEEARKMFKVAAEKFNFTDAQVTMGYMYDFGEGGDVNHEQAKMWYQNAADKGHEIASHNLAVILINADRGVTRNSELAIHYFKNAADKGYVPSMFALGYMFQYGQGIEINQKEAFHWYYKAAKNGNVEAQYKVGWAFQNGLGVDRNSQSALYWFTCSANNNYGPAQLELGMNLLQHVTMLPYFEDAFSWLVKSNCADATLCLEYLRENGPLQWKNRERSNRYFNIPFENGKESFMYNLGLKFLQREDEEKKNVRQALYWFEKAAENDYVHAFVAIGFMHILGKIDEGGVNFRKAYSFLSYAAKMDGADELQHLNQLKPLPQRSIIKVEDLERKYKITMKWYVKLSDDRRLIGKGCVSGLSCLGYLYYKGLGIRKDFDRAREIYLTVLRFIDEEDSDANMCLGLLYSKGLGVDRDDKRAMRYYKRSARYLNTYVYNLIGDAYKFGKGVEVNYCQAMYWYNKGATYKDGYSLLNIGKMYYEKLVSTPNTVDLAKLFQESFKLGCKRAIPYIITTLNQKGGNPNSSQHIRCSNGESSFQKPNALLD